ncbi:MAG TPA: leishmanolysin-related zinc metalloendopeptidase [Gemmatimonadales bacterium]|nr:leishmanolysin-related zinc metalloendopeptidase [Gemmatimonadales bacterium]
MTRSPLRAAALVLTALSLQSCGGAGADPSATIANLEALSGVGQGAPIGRSLPEPLVVRATDEEGNPISGQRIEFSVTIGNGQVAPEVATTGSDGRASTTFTVGSTKGNHQVQAVAAGTEFSATFDVLASGPPAVLEVAAGTGQSALPSSAVSVAPAVRVLDDQDDPAPGVEVQFAVAVGGGSVSGALATTDLEGIARVQGWTLGNSGVNTLTATVPDEGLAGDPALFVATVRPATGFNIEVRHQGSPSAAQLLAFAEAEVRWEQVIAADIPDLQVVASPGDCGPGSPALSEQVDDLLILANLIPIDGPGSVLGAAGPCFIRQPGSLPVVGQMRFDTDDLDLLEGNDILRVVILHEMGHVLGFGTMWKTLGLLADASIPGGADPHFTGPLAVAAFNGAGGAGYTGGKVPVEDTGGQGTADSHWRESVFDTELMTGFIGPGVNPMSAITLQSLADMGYSVNLSAADSYTLGAALRLGGSVASRGFELHDDIARGPIYILDERGATVGTVTR